MKQFSFSLEKILDLRIMKKEEQELAVVRARREVTRIENLIDANNQDIQSTRENRKTADFMMYEAYDNYLKHLFLHCFSHILCHPFFCRKKGPMFLFFSSPLS